MAKVVTKGVSEIATAPLEVDGGPGTVFTPVGYTSRDAETSITTAEPTVEELFANESDTAIDVTTTPGSTTITFSLMTHDADSMIEWLGGTKTGAGTGPSPYVYLAADVIPDLERSVRITPRSGLIQIYNRVKLTSLINYDMSPTGLFLVVVTGQVLQPLKAGTKKFSLSLPVIP